MKSALRQLLRSPGFSITVVLTLGLAIGLNAAAFSVLNRLLLQRLPFRESDRLVQVWSYWAKRGQGAHTPGDYLAEKRQNTILARMGSYFIFVNASVADPGQSPAIVSGLAIDADFLPTLGVEAALGRRFSGDDQKTELAGHSQCIMLGNAYWRTHYAADPQVIGRTIRFAGNAVTIVGVASPVLDDPELFGSRVDILSLESPERQPDDRVHDWFRVAGRLKPGVTMAQAQAQLGTIAARLAHDYPDSDALREVRLVPYPTDSIGTVGRNITWLVIGLTLAVLVIACANLANLQLARATGRAKEFAVRVALGASRFGIMRLLLAECIVLSLAGGLLGLLFAKWANASLAAFLGVDLTLDFRVIGFTLAVSTLAGCVFGTIPAWFVSRPDVHSNLVQVGRGASAGRSRHRLRHGLIVTELIFSLILLAAAGYFIRGIQRISHRELGWRPENVLVGSVWLPDGYGGVGSERNSAFGRQFRGELLSLPGVDQAAMSGGSPADWGYAYTTGVAVEGRPAEPKGQEPLAYTDMISPGFLETYGMRLLQGRDFTEADRRGGHPVAIIDKSMADSLWPRQSPLGRRFRDADPAHPEWIEVVGVTNDIIAGSTLNPPSTQNVFYVPYDQRGWSYPRFALHCSSDPRVLEDRVRHILAHIEPDVAVSHLETAEERMTSNLSVYTLVRRVLVEIAAVGLLLSAVGIYGVVANLAAERTREIGIRMALGAQPNDVYRLFLANGVRLALTGGVLGLLGSFGLVRILSSRIATVPGEDPWVEFGVAALLMLVALAACMLPAQKATRLDPLVALRAE